MLTVQLLGGPKWSPLFLLDDEEDKPRKRQESESLSTAVGVFSCEAVPVLRLGPRREELENSCNLPTMEADCAGSEI
jgi:hypothetical protein